MGRETISGPERAVQPKDAPATPSGVADIIQRYGESPDADDSYAELWGGEDVHIGLYDAPNVTVRMASRATLDRLTRILGSVPPDARVLDLGSGYGGTARNFAQRYDCHVTCLNSSEVQNARNRRQTEAQGLSGRIDIVQGNLESLPFDARAFDIVVSLDAMLHSRRRERMLKEVARVLRAKGSFVFTDLMQRDGCAPGVLAPVLERIHLKNLASFAFYQEWLGALGFEELGILDLTRHLGRHFARVREELLERYEEIAVRTSKDYLDRVLTGLGHWADAEAKGYLAWGLLHFRAP